MPVVEFESLPSNARVWVFAADVPLAAERERELLDAVDAFLTQWNAHGHPLRCARAWRDGRFLAVGVDQSTAGASGCSIDGLFRTLQRMQPVLGANLLPAGRVFWRDSAGAVVSGERAEFARLGRDGALNESTQVFDTTVTTANTWRTMFEREARDTWHGDLLMRGGSRAASPESPS